MNEKVLRATQRTEPGDLVGSVAALESRGVPGGTPTVEQTGYRRKGHAETISVEVVVDG